MKKKKQFFSGLSSDEANQLERMKKREEEEKERERKLILSGKLSPDHGSFKEDKFVKLQKQMETMSRQRGKKSTSVPRKASTKVRWQYMVHKLHITPDTQTEDENDVTATVLPDDLEQYVVKVRQDNPIYDAFENASDVDDLYRIAESLVDSAFR